MNCVLDNGVAILSPFRSQKIRIPLHNFELHVSIHEMFAHTCDPAYQSGTNSNS